MPPALAQYERNVQPDASVTDAVASKCFWLKLNTEGMGIIYNNRLGSQQKRQKKGSNGFDLV